MKFVNIIGTRPQYIKLAAMNLWFGEHDVINIETSQHYDYNMSQEFVEDFGLNINYKIDINKNPIYEIREILNKECPDCVILYGDTYSTLIGCCASKDFFSCHIEAGVRNHDRTIIEECIRIGADHFVDISFSPTIDGEKNLLDEGCSGVHVGDVMYDLAKHWEPKLKPIVDGEYIYMTIHRGINADSWVRIEEMLRQIGNTKIRTLFAVHPRTKKTIDGYKSMYKPHNIEFIEPCRYLESLSYIKYAKAVITDSGGVEKESYILKTPGIIVRPTTPWPETHADGWNRCVEPDYIEYAIKTVGPGHMWKEHYGDGTAGKKIIEELVKRYHA